jgi:hypothetical protein
MPIIALLALLWVAFVILVIAALSGWLVNIVYAFYVVTTSLVDVFCQLWIDISRLWSKKVELDETENFWHK